MSQPWFETTTWCRALTLAERSASLPADSPESPEVDAGLAKRRLERWRSQPPFGVDDSFEQRLALDHIAQTQLTQLLGEPAECLAARLTAAPPWQVELAEAYAAPASIFATPPPGEEILGFLDLAQPLVDRACERLRAEVAALTAAWPSGDLPLPFDPETIEELLLMNLPEPLLMRLSRTLVLELNVARLQGELEGESPAERFQSFVERLRRPEGARALFAEYPVLARQLTLCIDQWAAVGLEFLARLCADWPLIVDALAPDGAPGILVELLGGAGDTHRGGRSVMVAEFDSGLRVVYKPKSLAIDAHFQQLLQWLNRCSDELPLRTLQVLDRGDYGWVEFVERQGCNSTEEVERFYRRHGAYLALLYALNATDFHFENVIAAGEHPMLIDLETLFQPQMDVLDTTQAGLAAAQIMNESVLQIGLLPQRLWSDEDYAGIDISGLGGASGQLSPDRIPAAVDIGTDAMRFERRRVELPGDANRPTLDGVELNALDHVEEIVAGFDAMYRLLLEHRADLLAADGPLAPFAQDEIRVLLRPTRTYSQLLFEAFHPDLLRDGLERDLFFDRLWITVGMRPTLAGAVAVEQADLRQGDIPIFTSRPGSLDLWGASGAVIGGVLVTTGSAMVDRRLHRLSDADRQRQVWLIRASMATLAEEDAGPPLPPYRPAAAAQGIYRAELLDGVRALADELAAAAIYGADDATWLGLEAEGERNWTILPAGMDLYAGVPGIALFLAYAGARLPEPRYIELARRALNTIHREIELLRADMPAIGGFEGWGGLLYTLTHLGVLWEDPALLAQAEEIVTVIGDWVERDDALDIVRGAAGALGSLLAYYHCTASPKALEVAVACGDHLLAAARPMPQGLGWIAPRFGPQPLAGFAHGAAGIGWALLELAAVTGDGRYRAAAEQAIAYERSLYVPSAENWPDLRARTLSETGAGGEDEVAAAEDSPRFMVAWCHGAAGIGLARLAAIRHLDDPRLHDELQVALRTTLSAGFGQSHSLCHGDMGNLDLLLEASRTLDDPSWRDQIAHIAGRILDSMAYPGRQSGGPPGVELPGLMLGLAGMGYELLRLAAPEQVPSVLRLAPPVLAERVTAHLHRQQKDPDPQPG